METNHGEESDAYALDGPASNECCEVRSEYLDEGTEEVDEATDTNTLLSADDVSKSTCDECSHSCGCLKTGDRYADDGRIDVGSDQKDRLRGAPTGIAPTAVAYDVCYPRYRHRLMNRKDKNRHGASMFRKASYTLVTRTGRRLPKRETRYGRAAHRAGMVLPSTHLPVIKTSRT